MQQHIHCIVNSCHYWKNGNLCDANEILVTTDAFGDENPDAVDAHIANTLRPSGANTCMETCCKTFVPKGSDDIKADKVHRL
jgi:hypothetical protein